MMEKVYPSMEELIPNTLLARVPALLVDDLAMRYAGLGPKYLTDQINEDGRIINGCMFKSSIQDAIEEVVDAVFNTLVWLFKIHEGTKSIDMMDTALSVLENLIEVYALLVMERENDASVS